MTFLELQARFELRLQNHINKKLDIRTLDIEFYLNEGYRRFVEQWYINFESNESARKRLSPLVVSTVLDRATYYVSADDYKNSEKWQLPTDLRYFVLEQADLSLTDCHGDPTTKTYVKVIPIKLDYYNFHVDNPFKKPYEDLVWRIDDGSETSTLVRGDNITQIDNYRITYIKNPSTITLLSGTPETSEVEIYNEFTEEIIEKALEVAISTLQLINPPQNK